MSTFLYFIPNQKHVDAKALDDAGITALTSADSLSFVGVERGPEGQPGILFTASAKNADAKMPRIGYYPKQQTWQACNHGQFWLGYENSNPPHPASLQRDEFIDGHQVKLADGNEWTVPLARSFPAGSALPAALVLGPDGELITEALPEFAKLSQQAEQVFEAYVGEGEDIDTKNGWEIAINALSQNYRLSAWEISHLRLLSTNNWIDILTALIDGPEIQAFLESKKKDEDTASLSAGEQD